MIKLNYNEPEFKVVKAQSQDVMTASLDVVNGTWDTGAGSGSSSGSPSLDDMFSL